MCERQRRVLDVESPRRKSGDEHRALEKPGNPSVLVCMARSIKSLIRESDFGSWRRREEPSRCDLCLALHLFVVGCTG